MLLLSGLNQCKSVSANLHARAEAPKAELLLLSCKCPCQVLLHRSRPCRGTIGAQMWNSSVCKIDKPHLNRWPVGLVYPRGPKPTGSSAVPLLIASAHKRLKEWEWKGQGATDRLCNQLLQIKVNGQVVIPVQSGSAVFFLKNYNFSHSHWSAGRVHQASRWLTTIDNSVNPSIYMKYIEAQVWIFILANMNCHKYIYISGRTAEDYNA